MKILIKTIVFSMLLFASTLSALEPYQVAFETTECNGDSGFATVEIGNIHKVQTASCMHDGKKLKKLLVKKGQSFITYTMTYDEAKAVMQDVKLYNRARLRMMENSNSIIITK